MCQAVGIEHGCAPRIATPFGGGFGGSGLVCGALAGAVMAAGLKLGRDRPAQSRDAAYDATRELVDSFSGEMGSPLCRELTGVDLRTEDGRRKHLESGGRDRVCNPAIAFAARRAEKLLRG